MHFKRTLSLGLGALALGLASMHSASAYVITVQAGTTDYAAPPSIPFTLATIPGSGTNQFISNSTITTVPGISTISFSGGASTASGVYAGNVANIALSPLGSSNSTTPYLVAGGGGGTVTLTYTNSQTALNLLWGTVDTNAGRNVLITTAGGQTITGADIAAAVGGTFPNSTRNVAVEITGLNPFTTLTASDSSAAAFEFIPGTPVPEPMSLALVGAGLVGLGMVRRSRKV